MTKERAPSAPPSDRQPDWITIDTTPVIRTFMLLIGVFLADEHAETVFRHRLTWLVMLTLIVLVMNMLVLMFQQLVCMFVSVMLCKM